MDAGKLAGLVVAFAGVSFAQNAQDDVTESKQEVVQLQKQVELLAKKLNEVTTRQGRTTSSSRLGFARDSGSRACHARSTYLSGQRSSDFEHHPGGSGPRRGAPGSAAALPPVPRAAAPQQATDVPSSPLQIHPRRCQHHADRFMDMTGFWRDKDAASSMGSNFGSIPYNNTVQGNLSEFHFSEQNSRLGFRGGRRL